MDLRIGGTGTARGKHGFRQPAGCKHGHRPGKRYRLCNLRKCLHMACPLFMGTLDDYILTCPCHDWRFDIRDGRFLDASELSLKTYPTKTEGGKIYIDFN